jgi:uncharacterized membrane protein YeiH
MIMTVLAQDTLQIPIYLEFIAVFFLALSGGLVAARRGWDFSGTAALALVTATGGGLIRDGLFLQNGPPLLVRTPVYLLIVAGCVLVIIAFGRRIHDMRHFQGAVTFVDAWGIGAYSVVGCQLAINAGIGVVGAALIGVINAVGGGLLRDLLARSEPELFRPGTLSATASLAGCVLYLLLTVPFSVAPIIAAWCTIVLVFAVRMISERWGVTTKPIRGFKPPEGREVPGYGNNDLEE